MPRRDASARDHDEWERRSRCGGSRSRRSWRSGSGSSPRSRSTWPLVTKLGHTGHDAFDPRFQAWTIDWVQHKLASPASLFDANIFAPEPHTLAYSDSLLGIAIPMLPFRWLGVSPIGQLNIALLLSFATTFASGYLFGRVVTRSIVVATLTGVSVRVRPVRFGVERCDPRHRARRASAWPRPRRGGSPTAPAPNDHCSHRARCSSPRWCGRHRSRSIPVRTRSAPPR